MAGTTPNLALYLPGGGSTGTWVPDEVADVDPLNQNFVKIDTFAGQVGVQANRNQQFYGPAAAIASVTGMKTGDTYQESDGQQVQHRYNGTVWVPNENGMAIVRPTTLVNGTLNPDGSISFATAATVSMQGIFTSRFTSYRMEIDLDCTTAGTVGLQLLNGATVITASYFNGNVSIQGNTTVVGTHGGLTSQCQVIGSVVTHLLTDVVVARPFQASRTRFLVNSYGQNGAAVASVLNGGAIQTDATSYDGIRIMNSGVTMTGKITVFGITST